MIFLFCFASLGFAQDTPPRSKVAHYIPDYEGLEAPAIDGILDDEAWTVTSNGRGESAGFNSWCGQFQVDYAIDDPRQSMIVEGSETPTDNDDLSYRVWAVYDDEFLYISVAVLDLDWVNHLGPGDEDGQTWIEDSVEIFIDGNHNAVEGNVNDHPEEYATGGQFVMTSLGARRDKEAGDPSFGDGADDEWFASVLENEAFTGTNYEFRIKLSKIGNPKKGDTIGFNLAVNDADGASDTSNDYQARWTGLAHDESTYGDLYFGRRELTAPLIDQPITIDGKLDEGIWSQAAYAHISQYDGSVNQGYYPRDLDDLSGDIYVLHDDRYLYVAVDVLDDIIRADTEAPGAPEAAFWHDDSIEVMLDSDYSQTAGNNVGFGLSGKFSMTANSARRAVALGDYFFGPEDDMDWYAIHTITEKGYLVEYRILKDSILSPRDIELIGFNIAINEDDNDDPGPGDRDNQMTWDGEPNQERTYGALILGGPPTGIRDWELH